MALRKQRIKKLFYSVGEVCRMLGESEATLRHWEREFSHLSPKRSQGGTRQYTEANIEAFRSVQRLLRQQGLTIEGARAMLSKRRTSIERREIALTRLRSALSKLTALEGILKGGV